MQPIPQHMKMAGYPRELATRRGNLSLMICARNNIGTGLTPEIAGLLCDVTKEALNSCLHWGFTFIADKCILHCERPSKIRLGISCRREGYDITSPASWSNGFCAAAYVKLPRLAPGFNPIDGTRRGLHFVVLDGSGDFVDSRSFDTHQSGLPPHEGISQTPQLDMHRQMLARYAEFRERRIPTAYRPAQVLFHPKFTPEYVRPVIPGAARHQTEVRIQKWLSD